MKYPTFYDRIAIALGLGLLVIHLAFGLVP